MLKRILSLLLTAALLLSLCLPTFAAEAKEESPAAGKPREEMQYESGDFEYELDEDGAYISEYYGTASSVTVPAALDGHTVTGIGYGVFEGRENLTSVSLPNTIRWIGARAFAGCTGLKQITLPTGLNTLSAEVFQGAGLTALVVPDSVEKMENGICANCVDLVSATLPAGLTELWYDSFNGCVSLTTVNLPDTLEWIGARAFYGCESLTSVILPEGLTELWDYAFGACAGLTEVTVPASLLYVGCEDDNGPFADSGLTTIHFAEDLTAIPYCLFAGCTELTELTLPQRITRIEWRSFSGCTGLTELVLHEGLEQLGSCAFGDCTGLTSVSIPKSLNEADGSESNGPFAGCSALENVSFAQGITAIPDNLFSGCTGLKTVTIPTTVTQMGNCVFQGCTGLTNVNLSANCTEYGYGMFEGCTALTALTLPNRTKSVGGSFCKDCTSLTDVTLSAKLEEISDGMFRGCTALEQITVPALVKEIQTSAFEDCTALTGITFPANLEYIGERAFRNCAALTAITVPASVSGINEEAFADCAALTSVKLEGYSGDEKRWLGNGIFRNDPLLTNVDLGAKLEYIPYAAFTDCDSLAALVIPDTAESIGDEAFKNCLSLEEITIPRSVASISDTAFSYPGQLTIYGYLDSFAHTYALENDITFVSLDVPTESLVLDQTELTLLPWTEGQLTYTRLPENTTDPVVWSSSDEDVILVSETGAYEAREPGTAEITLTSGSLSAVCTVTVLQPIQDIWLNETWISLDCLDTFQLTAELNPENPSIPDLIWSSSDESVAVVDQTGLVTAVGKGQATVTASSQDGSGEEATCVVSVRNSIYIVTDPAELQSPHPYEDGMDDSWQYTLEGAESLLVRFSPETSVEDNPDRILVKDGAGNVIGDFTGKQLAGKTVVVPGDTVRICLHTDGSVTDYGFAVVSVTEGTAVPLQITAQPADQTVYSDATAVFDVTAEGSGLTYCWQFRTEEDSFWYDWSEGTEARLTVENAWNYDGYLFRCVVRDEFLQEAASREAVLTAVDRTWLETEPDDAVVLTNQTASFQVAARGWNLSYQWQLKTPASGKWVNSTLSAATTPSINVKATAERSGNLYRCVITDGLGTKTVTREALLTVLPELRIVGEPADATVTESETAVFHVSVEGPESLSYQWYCKAPGDDRFYMCSDRDGGETDTLQFVPGLDMDGYVFRCEISDNYFQNVQTRDALLTVFPNESGPEITVQPANKTLGVGKTAKFTVEAEGVGLSYRWQYKSPADSAWKNTTLTGAKTAALSVGVTAGRNKYQYRCVVTDSAGREVISRAATLTVSTTILSQPVSVELPIGETAEFTVDATGPALTYQWQYKSPADSAWKNTTLTGAKTDTLSVGVTAGRNKYLYRCVITNANGSKKYSEAAELTVMPVITTQPADQKAEAGKTVKFTVKATGAKLTYQWQYKAPTGDAWKNTTLTGAKTATLSVEVKTSRNNYLYRCVITDANGEALTSDPGKLQVKTVITAQPEDATVPVGETAEFTVAAQGAGLTYQWQYKSPSASAWKNTTLTGAKTATLSVGVTTGRNDYQYRCVVTDANGVKTYSSAALLQTALVIKTQPKAASGKAGEIVKFTIKATGANLTYQWQYRTADSSTWKNTTLDGCKTATLSVEAKTSRNGWRYRCIVTDANGASLTSSAAKLTVE